jgi:hypothetical protein
MGIGKDIQRFGCWQSDMGKKLNPVSDIMLAFAIFSPISEVLILGSVWYRSSQISDTVQ